MLLVPSFVKHWSPVATVVRLFNNVPEGVTMIVVETVVVTEVKVAVSVPVTVTTVVEVTVVSILAVDVTVTVAVEVMDLGANV